MRKNAGNTSFLAPTVLDIGHWLWPCVSKSKNKQMETDAGILRVFYGGRATTCGAFPINPVVVAGCAGILPENRIQIYLAGGMKHGIPLGLILPKTGGS